ncbi:MAG: helix-turn-helix domain-containing protein [Patescibacteria group bacterium]|jgi:DNA-binding MarR family transcriptional regulator|nr:helix-turn-helix domain-containing protein [Patescibacteria group bacterium]
MEKYPRFWIRKDFIRHHAKNIKTIDQTVYMALSFFVNKERKTFVGYRTIGKILKINKNTVMKAVNNLIAYGLVRRLDKKENGRPSELQLTTVLFGELEPSETVRPKELKKELLKEEKRFFKNNKPESVGQIMEKYKNISGLERLRETAENLRQNQIKKTKNGMSKGNESNTIKKGGILTD